MASEYTTNFNLDKYASSDKPNLRDQYNSAMDKIDDQLHKLDSKYNDTSNGLFAFTQKAKEITEKYDSLNSRLTDNEASINEAKATIEDNKKIARDDAKKNADDIKENAKNLKLAEGDRHSLHTMLDTVSTRVTGLNEDVDIAKQEVHNFEKKIGEFQEEIKTNDRENKEAIADVDKRVNNKFDTYKHETDAGITVIKGDLKAHVKVCDEKLAKNIQAIEETKRDLTVTNKAVADQSVRDDENFLRAMQAINENKDKIKANTQKNEQQDEAISNARTKEEQDHLAQQKQIDANIAQLEQHKSTLSEHDARIHDNTDKINKYHDEDVAYKKTYSEKVDNAVVKVDQFNKDLLEAKKQITDQSVRDDTNFNDVKQKYSEVKELADKHDNTIKNLIYFADTTKAVFTDVDKALQDRYTKAESDAKYETIANATAHDQSLEVTQNKLNAVEAKQNEINTKTLQHDEAIQHLKDSVSGRATAQDLALLKEALDQNKDGKLDFIENAEKLNQLESSMHTELEKKATRDELTQAIANAKNELATNSDTKLKDYVTNAQASKDYSDLHNAITQVSTDTANLLKSYETKEDADKAHNELKSSIQQVVTDTNDKLKGYVTEDSADMNYVNNDELRNTKEELTAKINEKANKSDVPSIDSIKQAVTTDTDSKISEKLKDYETVEHAKNNAIAFTTSVKRLTDDLTTKVDKSTFNSQIEDIKKSKCTIVKDGGVIVHRQEITIGHDLQEPYPDEALTTVQYVNAKLDDKANKSDIPNADTITNAVRDKLDPQLTELMKSSRYALDKKTSVYTYKDNVGDPVSSINTTVGVDEINYVHIDNYMGGRPVLADTKYVDWSFNQQKSVFETKEDAQETKNTVQSLIVKPFTRLQKINYTHDGDDLIGHPEPLKTATVLDKASADAAGGRDKTLSDSYLTTKDYVDDVVKKKAGGTKITAWTWPATSDGQVMEIPVPEAHILFNSDPDELNEDQLQASTGFIPTKLYVDTAIRKAKSSSTTGTVIKKANGYKLPDLHITSPTDNENEIKKYDNGYIATLNDVKSYVDKPNIGELNLHYIGVEPGEFKQKAHDCHGIVYIGIIYRDYYGGEILAKIDNILSVNNTYVISESHSTLGMASKMCVPLSEYEFIKGAALLTNNHLNSALKNIDGVETITPKMRIVNGVLEYELEYNAYYHINAAMKSNIELDHIDVFKIIYASV